MKKIYDVEKIVNMYVNEGIPYSKIAKDLKIDHKKIREILIENKVKINSDRISVKQFTEEQKKQIVEMYKNQIGTREISKLFKCNPSKIKTVLDKNSILILKKQRQYGCNDNFFEKINNELNAYWLGFMYADGNVGLENNSITLNLAKKDEDHVWLFKQHLDSDHPIRYEERSTFGSKRQFCKLTVNSEKMKNDLIKLGCIPNKSLTLKFPTEEQVPKELIIPFIRGLIDGDGFVSKNTNNLGLCGTLDVVTNTFKNLFGEREKKYYTNGNSKENWSFKIHSKADFEFATNLLYENAKVYLIRKNPLV